MRAGGWKIWSPMFMTGQDVFGATLGVVGFGRIGQAVARRARGFNMKVRYYDVKPIPAEASWRSTVPWTTCSGSRTSFPCTST